MPSPVRAALNLETLSDEDLLREVVGGRRGAWRVFSERFDGLMFSLAARVSTRAGFALPSEELSDVVQEIRLRIIEHDYRRLRSYRSERGTKVSSWIGVIAGSATRDYVRRMRRHRTDSWSVEDFDGLPSADVGVEQRLIEAQEAKILHAALEDLPPRDREFARLCFIEDRSSEEVARAMQISLGTSYSKKCRITDRVVTSLHASSSR